MKDLPPPPPEVYEWCARHLELPACVHLLSSTPGAVWSFDAWLLLIVVVLLGLALIGYLVWSVRAAYIGARYLRAVGGYKPAVRHLERIQADNEALLAGGLSIHAFTQGGAP